MIKFIFIILFVESILLYVNCDLSSISDKYRYDNIKFGEAVIHKYHMNCIEIYLESNMHFNAYLERNNTIIDYFDNKKNHKLEYNKNDKHKSHFKLTIINDSVFNENEIIVIREHKICDKYTNISPHSGTKKYLFSVLEIILVIIGVLIGILIGILGIVISLSLIINTFIALNNLFTNCKIKINEINSQSNRRIEGVKYVDNNSDDISSNSDYRKLTIEA